MSLLNGSSVNKTVLNGAVGASVFTQAVTASSTSSSALVRAAGVIRSVTSSSAVSKLVLAGKLITYLSASATSVKKAITRAASAVSSTSTATVLKQAKKPLTSTASTSTASLVRSARKIAAVTSTSTVSYLRALTKTISFSSTSVATAIKAVVKTAFSTSSTTTNTLVRRTNKPLSVVSTSTSSLVRAVAHILSVLSTTTNSLTKSIRKTVSVASATTNTLLKQATKTFSVVSTSVSSLIKKVLMICITLGNKYVITGGVNGLTLNQIPINSDSPVYTTTTGVTSQATIYVNSFYYKVLTYLQSSASTLSGSATRIKLLSVLSTTTNTITKAVQTTLSVASSVVTSVLKSVKKIVNAGASTTTTTLSRSLRYVVNLTYVVTKALSLQKVAAKSIVVASTSSAKLYLGRFKTLTTTAAVSVASLVKQVRLVLITLGNKYVITGGLGSSYLNQLSINADVPVYTTTTGVTSNAVVYVNSLFYKTLSYLQTTVSSISRIYVLVRTFTAASTSVSSIVRSTATTLTAAVSQTATLVKRALLILITFGTKYTNIGAVGNVIGNSLTLNADNPLYTSTAGIVSTATVSVNTLFYRTLSVLQSTANSITTASSRLITLVVTAVTSTVRVVKDVSKTVNAVVSSAASVVKKALLTLITYGVKYTNIGAVGNVLVNGLALNADNPLYTATAGITTTATVGVQTLYYRTLSAVQSVLATIAAANIKLATLVASVVTSTNRLIKDVATTQSVVVSNVVSVVKRVLMTLITFGVKYTNIGAVGNVLVNGLSLNSDNPLYTSTAGIATTATVSTITFYRRTLAALQSAVSSLSIASIYFRNLVSSVVLSVSTVVKNIDKPLAVAVSTVTTAVKTIYKELITFGVKYTNIGAVGNVLVNSLSLNSDNPLYTATAGITTTATLSTLSIYRRTLAALSNVAATLSAFWLTYKILTASIVISVAVILSNVQISLSYLVTSVSSYTRFVTRFVLLVTTAYTSVVAYAAYIFVSFQDTLMVRARKISARKLADFISIRVSPKKTNITVVDQDDLNG